LRVTPVRRSQALIALKGLKAIYGEQHPQRRRIKVEIKNDITAGTTGVVARIVGLITAAALETDSRVSPGISIDAICSSAKRTFLGASDLNGSTPAPACN